MFSHNDLQGGKETLSVEMRSLNNSLWSYATWKETCPWWS